RQRPGKRANVQPVGTGAVAAVGAFAHLDDIGSVGRHNDAASRVLIEHRRVVAGRQFKPFAIQNGDIRIKQRTAEAHAFNLGGKALTLLAFDGEIVYILVVDDALDGDVKRNLLRSGKVAVRLFFIHNGQGADVESTQFRDASGGADADGVFAKATVGRDLDGDLDLGVVDDFEFHGR